MQESTGQQYDNKTGQWFGSLVTSSGEDGVVLVRHQSSFTVEVFFSATILRLFGFPLGFMLMVTFRKTESL